ncbi:trichome birefringence-like protein 3 [Tanacetum coccineum]
MACLAHVTGWDVGLYLYLFSYAMTYANNLNKEGSLGGSINYGELSASMQRLNESARISNYLQPRQVEGVNANLMGSADAYTHIQVKQNAHSNFRDGSDMDGKKGTSPMFADIEVNSTSFSVFKTFSTMQGSNIDVTNVVEESGLNVSKSFANVVQSSFQSPTQAEEKLTKNVKLKFRSFFNDETVVDSNYVLPLANLQAIKHKFENNLVGYFVGKSVAFQHFDSITGVEHVLEFPFTQKKKHVLEQGPWMIRNTPIILNKWSLNLSLCKDKVTSVPVWVKLHKVPVVAYFEDGLSLIASQIGKPVMLDALTSSMYNDPWGRIGFARALIKVSATTELKKEVIMVVPHEDGTGHTKVLITVEYEWKLPLCVDCHVFGHISDLCPKRVVEPITTTVEDKSDRFTTVMNKRRKRKMQVNPNINKHGGIKLNKTKTFEYRPVATSKAANKEVKKMLLISLLLVSTHLMLLVL